MKDSDLTIAIREDIDIFLTAMEELIKEEIEPIADIGNPEKLLKKPYEQWTEQDLMTARAVYGNELEEFIFKKEYKRMTELEEAVE